VGIAAGSDGPDRSPQWSRYPKAARLRHLARMRLSEHPFLYLPLARRRYPGPSPEVIGPATELVIDGFTRSATTFAVYAFQLAQDRPVRLAHHLHAPAQLVEAARRGIPAIALIREPEGALLSQVIQEPDVTLPVALLSYSRFYERLMPFRSRLVVGRFDEVTTDMGAVIRRVNAHFGTSFEPFVPTAGNVQACLELMSERPTPIPRWSSTLLSWESGKVTKEELQREWADVAHLSSSASTRTAWVPSRERQHVKEALRSEWEHPRLEGLRGRAERVYREFIAVERPAVNSC
jgi:hypothetical protein